MKEQLYTRGYRAKYCVPLAHGTFAPPPLRLKMNLFGSYCALLTHSVAALGAAVDIYNRPNMKYREESFVILLVNAWELLLKGVLSKHKRRIYYSKKPGQPYRSLSISDALTRSEPMFPQEVAYRPTSENLRLLIQYRDSAIHFYNRPGMGSLIYGLAQTATVNYRDVVQAVFDRDVADDITLSLFPLSIASPVDPVEFLRKKSASTKSGPIEEFTRQVRELVSSLEADGQDTGRLFTTFSVHLRSTKKISSADFVVGVDGSGGSGHVLVNRSVDPNKTHRYRESDILGRKGVHEGMNLKVGGIKIGQHQFRALVKAYDARSKIEYCWRDATGAITRYSGSWVDFIKRLKEDDLKEAVRNYQVRTL